MAVSKRTRFEVLRRDNYTCRYCRSTENELTVDHVTPVALGGTDDPSNLVAACKDCNAGKSSSAPDAETVAQVEEDALRWSAAMREAARRVRAKRDVHSADIDWFRVTWNACTVDAELPDNWKATVRNYLTAGLDRSDMEEAIDAATARLSPYSSWKFFPYFRGVCRNKVQAIREAAEAILSEEADADA